MSRALRCATGEAGVITDLVRQALVLQKYEAVGTNIMLQDGKVDDTCAILGPDLLSFIVIGTAGESVSGPLRAPTEVIHQHDLFRGIETAQWMDGVTNPTQPGSTSLNGNNPAAAPHHQSAYCAFKLLGDLVGYDPKSHVANGEIITTDSPLLAPSLLASAAPSASSTTSSTSDDVNLESSRIDPTILAPTSTSSGTQPQRDKADGQWLQKLVEINLKLFNHASTAADLFSIASSGPSEGTASSAISDQHGNGFDETLLLSLHFVQALRKLHGTSSLDLPVYTAAALPPPLDPGSTLIVYSCYVRVLDLITERLGTIRVALGRDPASLSSSPRDFATGTPTSTTYSTPNAANVVPPIPLPTISTGSCSLEAYPILRLRMTLELVDELLDVMSALVSPLMRGFGNQGQREEEISRQALLTRKENAYEIIVQIRRELKSSRREKYGLARNSLLSL